MGKLFLLLIFYISGSSSNGLFGYRFVKSVFFFLKIKKHKINIKNMSDSLFLVLKNTKILNSNNKNSFQITPSMFGSYFLKLF